MTVGQLTPCLIFIYLYVERICDNRKTLFFICTQVPPPAITVTIEQDWNVTSVGKPIPAPYTTQVTNGTVLVDIMNKAANEETNGPYNKYTSTYYGGLGHFITSMNGTKQVSIQHINSPNMLFIYFHMFPIELVLLRDHFLLLVKIKKGKNRFRTSSDMRGNLEWDWRAAFLYMDFTVF